MAATEPIARLVASVLAESGLADGTYRLVPISIDEDRKSVV